MRKLYLWLVAGVLLLAIGLYVYYASTRNIEGYIDPSDTELVTLGRQVYSMQCASCHGVNLEGEPNWRQRKQNGRLPAPPHDVSGHTWHHPDQVLFDIVKNGLVPGVTAPAGYESDMPAYADILTDKEIRASLAYIKSSWPDKARSVQTQLTQEYQKVQ
ncbi:MAG: cytochrome C oxidase Cbb3 [Pusillimonas sp.]|jgi:mono/diheme cytochrome c family protein|nr:cytochrome C oxidase Cbb3 [Pusillimonas sp.]